MNNLITINKTQMPVAEYKGQRVITFSMIDLVHARPDGTARAAFNRNREHFIEGIDFHEVGSDVIRTDLPEGIFSKFAPSGIVLFESGYLMLTKPFNDDVAWQVQRELVNSYFRPPQTAISELEMIARIASHNAQQQRQLNRIDEKVEQMHETVEQIKQGTIPVGYQGYSYLCATYGISNAKCRQLVKGFNIPSKRVPHYSPNGQVTQMTVVHDESFKRELELVMREAELKGARWYHPKMGLFQAIGWEAK